VVELGNRLSIFRETAQEPKEIDNKRRSKNFTSFPSRNLVCKLNYEEKIIVHKIGANKLDINAIQIWEIWFSNAIWWVLSIGVYFLSTFSKYLHTKTASRIVYYLQAILIINNSLFFWTAFFLKVCRYLMFLKVDTHILSRPLENSKKIILFLFFFNRIKIFFVQFFFALIENKVG